MERSGQEGASLTSLAVQKHQLPLFLGVKEETLTLESGESSEDKPLLRIKPYWFGVLLPKQS